MLVMKCPKKKTKAFENPFQKNSFFVLAVMSWFSKHHRKPEKATGITRNMSNGWKASVSSAP